MIGKQKIEMEEKKVKRAKGNRKVIISGVLAGALLFASVSEINLTKMK